MDEVEYVKFLFDECFLYDSLKNVTLTEQTELTEYFDEIDIIEFLMYLESFFGFEIDAGVENDLKTVKDVVVLVDKLKTKSYM